MYVPKHFEETDIAVLHALIRSHALGTWVTSALEVNHIPFRIDPSRGVCGTLVAHVARANPVWRALSAQAESVVIFQGAQAYITPSWYPAKQAHGKVVPTWNYAVVHAHGIASAIEDRDWLLEHVTGLSEEHESARAMPWKVSDAPADYIDSLLRSIVGIEMPVSRLVGKWKVSQNRSAEDRNGVLSGLLERGDSASLEMAGLVDRKGSGI